MTPVPEFVLLQAAHHDPWRDPYLTCEIHDIAITCQLS